MRTAIVLCLLLTVPGVAGAQRLGAPPAALETPYQTEHAWALGEIVADINEIARYRAKRPEPPAPVDGIAPWRPELLQGYALSALAPVRGVRPDQSDPPNQFDKLLSLLPDEIIKADAIVSAALKREMRSPRAHEAAAMVLAAFGLRESASNMSDSRWVLNRMTAHLAVSAALRNDQSTPSIDGQIARTILSILAGRQRTAAAAIDAWTPPAPTLAAWQRALRMRLTEDWRILASPATATRLEKLEYFRARRHTVRGIRGGQDLSEMREPVAADFARILQGRSSGVEDGATFVLPGLAHELDELAVVYQRLHQKALPNQLPAALVNVRAGRLLAGGEPRVIPWGAWAEFAQRHIGMSIEKVDSHYRHMLGLADRADQIKRELDARLGHLTLYPLASTRRTKGRRGTEADLSQIARAIDLAVRAPELVSYDFWSYLEFGANYEPLTRGMPAKRTWFAPLSADVPYDAGLRAEGLLGYLKPPAVEALMQEAPYNISLLSRVVQRYRMLRPMMLTVRALIEPRVGYDLWAIDSAINVARDPDDRMALRRKACELAVNECLELAWELTASDEAGAAAEYEKAFRNPALDQVQLANASAWLVSYYERHGQLPRAMDLAQRSAAVGSSAGLVTYGRLLERRARIDEADEAFSAIAMRYPDANAELAGFLYRQAIVAKNAAYLARWKAIEAALFPAGLQPTPAAIAQKPANGVFVEQDSHWSRNVRLQAGDIIVGVDGWKVDNLEQYKAVIAFLPTEARHQLTAWRGVLFTVTLGARHGMTLKTHPLKGWIE